MSEMVAPGTSYHDPHEGEGSGCASAPRYPAPLQVAGYPSVCFSEVVASYPEMLPQVWVGEHDPDNLWYCLDCFTAVREADLLAVYDLYYVEAYSFGCPLCIEQGCGGESLYRWEGWPSRVLQVQPVPGVKYPLPDSINSEELEEPDQP